MAIALLSSLMIFLVIQGIINNDTKTLLPKVAIISSAILGFCIK